MAAVCAITTDYAFSLPKDEWEHYMQYRPKYPDSMWHMWLDYHQGPLDTLHDLGTGCGIAAASMISAAEARGRPIKHVVLSDPSESNITTTKGLLTPKLFPGVRRFSYHQSPAEQLVLEPGSVDMVMACECLHWTEIETAVARMHDSLRPGGTLAAVFYAPGDVRMRGNAAAEAAWTRLLDELLTGPWGPAAPRDSTSSPASSRERQVLAGLNFVRLDRALWQDCRRVWVNAAEGETGWLPSSIQGCARDEKSWIDREHEALEWVTEDVGDWVKKDCTVEWVKGMLVSTPAGLNTTFWEWDSWKAFVAAVGSETFWLIHKTSYIMARKK